MRSRAHALVLGGQASRSEQSFDNRRGEIARAPEDRKYISLSSATKFAQSTQNTIDTVILNYLDNEALKVYHASVSWGVAVLDHELRTPCEHQFHRARGTGGDPTLIPEELYQ